jgi:flagellar FliL protein
MYTNIGRITTKTKDTDANYTVTVEMNLGYDLEDAMASSELSSRQYELRDFVRSYFTGKYAEELKPENEAKLKQDIKEILNTRFLDTAKVRIVLFDKLDVMEAF